jgi:N-acetylglucosaminyldiphosphoundecaprenol N-acetyl-beta-D-mannosaminyltransferase
MQSEEVKEYLQDEVRYIDKVSRARVNILGVGVDAVDMNQAVASIVSSVATQKKGYVCLGGVHGIMEAQRDMRLRTVYEKAALVAPDGMPTVWIGRLQGFCAIRRVFGPDLMIEVMKNAELRDCSHFLCGGDDGVAEELRDRLMMRFPYLRIAGSYAPPFRAMTASEEAEMVADVARTKPDIIWVGMGTPKQDLFMAKYLPLLNTSVMIGVGAAFLYHTGRLRDSPRWVKQAGLQWVDRLIQEPRRLWKRYLVGNPKFIALLAMQLAGLKRYPLANSLSDGQ